MCENVGMAVSRASNIQAVAMFEVVQQIETLRASRNRQKSERFAWSLMVECEPQLVRKPQRKGTFY